jgi:hypothetical protein
MMFLITQKWPTSWGGHFGGVARYNFDILSDEKIFMDLIPFPYRSAAHTWATTSLPVVSLCSSFISLRNNIAKNAERISPALTYGMPLEADIFAAKIGAMSPATLPIECAMPVPVPLQ